MSRPRGVSSSSSSHSFIDSISQTDLIEYFPRTYLRLVEKEMVIMNKIKRLKESGVNEVGLQYVNEFRNNKQILCNIGHRFSYKSHIL